MGELILRDVLVIFLVAIPIVLIAHRMNLPSIVGFLLTGLLIGPEGLGFISDAGRIELLAEVGLALLLFHVGLELSSANLRGLKSVVLGGGAIQIVATIFAGIVFAVLLHWPVADGLYVGCAAASSSTAIVLAFLSYKRWLDSPAGRISTGITILQDLAVVPMLVLLPIITLGSLSQGWTWGLLLPLLKIALVFGLMWLVYRFILGALLHQVAHSGSKELFIIILIGMALGFAWFTQRLGLSFALGAFLSGLMVAATPFRFHALSEMAPFRACVSGLFFVSLGMIVSPGFIGQHAASVGGLVVFVMVAKIIITAGAILLFRYPLGVAVIVGMILGPMGEFSFLLASVGYHDEVISRDLYQLLVASSGVSIVLAPLLMQLSGHVVRFPGLFSKKKVARVEGPAGEYGVVEKMRDHAIICGFGPLGRTIGDLIEKAGTPYIVLELNPRTAKRLRDSNKIVYIGDGASPELLSHSGVERAKLIAIAVPDYVNSLAIIRQARRLNPQIAIVTRSRYRDHVEDFYDAGADVVVCEELEAGVEMGRYVLLELGISEEDSRRFVSEIRSFGSADFF